MNHIVNNYEHYREENRLTTDFARKVEYITTIRAFSELFPKEGKILDCAAGTGIYAIYLADRGYDVTATDITPRHIDYINKRLEEKHYKMQTLVLDATNLSCFEDETFDVVLNMGPFYHLTDSGLRDRCMTECCRVLKKGGLLVTAYIPRYFIFPYLIKGNHEYLNSNLGNQFIHSGILKQEDEDCFWTDSYYSSAEEMEHIYLDNKLTVADHFAQDGISTLLGDSINQCSEEEFEKWCEYHYQTCREKSILGTSNHVIIAGIKK